MTNLVPAPGHSLESWQPAALWIAAVANTPATQATYAKIIRGFARGAQMPPAAVTGQTVADYKAFMVQQGLSIRTIRLRLTALRSFFEWAIREGHTAGPNPVDAVHVPVVGADLAGRALTDAQIAALLAVARHARDRAMIHLLAGAGLRAGEMTLLTQRDFQPGEPAVILVRRGKGGKVRRVPLPEPGAAALAEYLAGDGRKRGATAPLLQHLDGSGAALSYDTVYHVVVECGERAGLGHLTPHDLRRTHITLRLDRGDPLPQVQKDVGHSTMMETALYYRGTGEQYIKDIGS